MTLAALSGSQAAIRLTKRLLPKWWKLATLPNHLLRSAMFRVLLALTIISLAPDLLQFFVQHIKHNMRAGATAAQLSVSQPWAVRPQRWFEKRSEQ